MYYVYQQISEARMSDKIKLPSPFTRDDLRAIIKKELGPMMDIDGADQINIGYISADGLIYLNHKTATYYVRTRIEKSRRWFSRKLLFDKFSQLTDPQGFRNRESMPDGGRVMGSNEIYEAKHPSQYAERIPIPNTEDAPEIARQALGPIADISDKLWFDVGYDDRDGVYLIPIHEDNGGGQLVTIHGAVNRVIDAPDEARHWTEEQWEQYRRKVQQQNGAYIKRSRLLHVVQMLLDLPFDDNF